MKTRLQARVVSAAGRSVGRKKFRVWISELDQGEYCMIVLKNIALDRYDLYIHE